MNYINGNGNGKNMGPYIEIEGGHPLRGVLEAGGAKNAALPIMAGAILAPGKIELCRVPDITDTRVMTQLLRHLGAEVDFDDNGCMDIDTTGINITEAPYALVKKLNASFDVTGALVARFGDAKVPLPGGCVFGTRAVDQHLSGFENLGCEVTQEPGGFVRVKAKKLKGAKVHFLKTSVGATKNVMMAACLARGKTILENVAREPEVVDLANFLNACGARITGQGTARIEIQGVKSMQGGIKYKIIPDRIEAGTYLLAAAITGGHVKINGISPDYLKAFIRKLRKAGQEVILGDEFVKVESRWPIESVGAVITEPYPGFPTDLQPPIVSFLAIAEGVSYVKEKIFNMRFNYVDDLRRMGADIRMDGNTAAVTGVEKLLGAPVDAPDIRAGGALVIAALGAEGMSKVYGTRYIDRGYEKIEEKLNSLGAKVRRVEN